MPHIKEIVITAPHAVTVAVSFFMNKRNADLNERNADSLGKLYKYFHKHPIVNLSLISLQQKVSSRGVLFPL